MDGQADQAPETIDSVAAFLVDNPEADRDEDEGATGEGLADANNPDPENPGSDEPGSDPDDTNDDDQGGKPKADDNGDATNRQGLKFKVPVKGDDGADTTIEVDEKELVAGYQRHADYTRKTQELGTREREATELLDRRHGEMRTFYMNEAAKVHRMIAELADLKSDQEMLALAQKDPAAYQAEKARQDFVRSKMAEIEGSIRNEHQQGQQQGQQSILQATKEAWGVLGPKGITKERVSTVFDRMQKDFGVPEERFKKLTDPKLVLIMDAAAKWLEATEKAKSSTKQKLEKAPRLPAQRQATPRQTQTNNKLDRRFQSGKAGVRDLGAWIANNT